jgi:hypothetical protein
LPLKSTAMPTNLTGFEKGYLKLYNYLLVMDETQIRKLRKIVTGILPLQAFTEDEIHLLETRALSISEKKMRQLV